MPGACARAAAWMPLRGLLDSEDKAMPKRVQDVADATTWTHFSAKTNWFYQVGWDIEIAAFRPDTHSLNVFAATDTD